MLRIIAQLCGVPAANSALHIAADIMRVDGRQNQNKSQKGPMTEVELLIGDRNPATAAPRFGRQNRDTLATARLAPASRIWLALWRSHFWRLAGSF
jgi:hypothetical protein